MVLVFFFNMHGLVVYVWLYLLLSSLAFPVFKLEGNVLALGSQLHHLLCFCLIDKIQTSDVCVCVLGGVSHHWAKTKCKFLAGTEQGYWIVLVIVTNMVYQSTVTGDRGKKRLPKDRWFVNYKFKSSKSSSWREAPRTTKMISKYILYDDTSNNF